MKLISENPIFLETAHRLLHGNPTTSVFTDSLTNASAGYYGTASQPLIDGITKMLRPEIDVGGRIQANWLKNELTSTPKVMNPMPFLPLRTEVLNTNLR